MPTPETQRVRSVEEIGREQHIHWLEKSSTAQIKAKKDGGVIELTVLPYGYLSTAIEETLTQDRHSLYTSLVEAVEGLAVDEGWKNNGIYTGGFDQAKEEFLTIINSIFKE